MHSVSATSADTAPSRIGGSEADRWSEIFSRIAKNAGLSITEHQPAKGEGFNSWARRLDIPEVLLAQAAAEVLQVEFVSNLSGWRPLPAYVQSCPIGYARQHCTLAFLDKNESAILAMPSLSAWDAIEVARRVLHCPVRPVLAPRDEIAKAINSAYEQQSSQPDAALNALEANANGTDGRGGLESLQDLLATQGQAPVVELVNLLLLDAVKAGASDIHFQPYRERLAVRYRIDGVLFDAHSLPKSIQEEAISRIKIIGKMNIAEKRLPQDGRASVTAGNRMVDLRIASLPGSYGERVVLRLLDKSAGLYTLDEIGMKGPVGNRFRELIKLEHGLILLTGPTGSGKTTTLYAALQEINSRDRNVVTLEDPIEYDIDGISQTQINTKKGLTFASGLRNVLRQDPDIIMVGEIRDQETAIMAIQSALTGHLVFSTLHTNDAASAVARLLDLGIEPYLVSSSLLAVLAQRLVRSVCRGCGQEQELSQEELQQIGFTESIEQKNSYRIGKGCAECRSTGYKGRAAISELLVVDEPIRQKIQARASATEIRDVACSRGMRLLREDGLAKILAGITTPEEVARVTVRASL